MINQKISFFFSQKTFVLFGAPGVGKGTFAKLLVKDLNYNHISTGDEIRKILKGQVKIIKIKILSYFIHNYKGTSII